MSLPIPRASRTLPTSLLALVAGCSLEFTPMEEVQNGCETSSDCASGDVCVEKTALGRGVCATTEVELGTVLLEVRPTDGQVAYVFADAVTLESSAQGVVAELELRLPEVRPVTGRFLAPNAEPSCKSADGSIPVSVSLLRRFEAGPFRSEFQALSESDQASSPFELSVPAGSYDAYLVPTPVEGCAPIAPILRRVEVTEDGLDLTLEDEAIKLTGRIEVPEGANVEGWRLDVVDSKYGRVLSEPFTLSNPGRGEKEVAIGGADGVRYNPTESAILRLSDASGGLSIHWNLAALDLDSDGDVDIDIFDLLAVPEKTEARVIDPDYTPVPNAQVTIASESLTGSVNQNASFRVNAVSDAAGVVKVGLLPGTYNVTVIPPVPGLASYSGTWTVAEKSGEPQDTPGGFGIGLQLSKQSSVRGMVEDAFGAELAAAPIWLGPSQADAGDYFEQALGSIGAVSRVSATTTDATGAFETLVDPGTLDLSVQLDSATGYPWFVRPSLVVAPDQPSQDLGPLAIEAPAIVQGVLRDASGDAISLGLVRAYVPAAPTAPDANEPSALIQIGSTSSGPDGRFFLPLPRRITVASEP
jgi:hypothetical protein